MRARRVLAGLLTLLAAGPAALAQTGPENAPAAPTGEATEGTAAGGETTPTETTTTETTEDKGPRSFEEFEKLSRTELGGFFERTRFSMNAGDDTHALAATWAFGL